MQQNTANRKTKRTTENSNSLPAKSSEDDELTVRTPEQTVDRTLLQGL